MYLAPVHTLNQYCRGYCMLFIIRFLFFWLYLLIIRDHLETSPRKIEWYRMPWWRALGPDDSVVFYVWTRSKAKSWNLELRPTIVISESERWSRNYHTTLPSQPIKVTVLPGKFFQIICKPIISWFGFEQEKYITN